MLKTLLQERFKLRAHVERRERPIYRLVFAHADKRLGPAIRATGCRADDLDCGKTSANTNGIRSAGSSMPPGPRGGSTSSCGGTRISPASRHFPSNWA